MISHRTVTVVVPHYNDSENALACLQSIRRYLPLARIILSDAGSAPQHREQVRGHPDLYDVFLTEEYRLWGAEARNRGWLASKDPYTIFCDCDVEFIGCGWLDRHLELLDYLSEVQVVGGWGEPWLFGPELKAYSLWDLEGWPGRTRTVWNTQPAPAGYCEMLNGGLLTVRTEFRSRVLWDGRQPRLDDIAFCCRVLDAGGKLFYSPAEIIHRMGEKPGVFAPNDFPRSLAAVMGFYGQHGRARLNREEALRFLVTGDRP